MSKDSEAKFDEMLFRVLKRHSEPVPADFADKMLRQIKKTENEKTLARVIMQERLALVGCIVLGIITIVAVLVFPGTTINFTELAETSADKITQTIEAARYNWRLYAVFAGVFLFTAYSFAALLVNDSR
ncbi:MAG: hypothetical protein PHY02_08810 [Phycisphaerae bacterium]|nr:hypothetical protein [Phycisphaerae bacterium]